MGKYLITGRQGSGKTTVIKLLQKMGYTAYNTDDLPEVTKLQNIQTGETVSWPKNKVDWSRFAWNWQEEALKKILDSDETVFVGAVVSNQLTFYPLFDKIFVLIVGADTLRHRLEAHEHDSHHLPGTIDRILTDHESKQEHFINEGVVPIAANQTPEKIAEEILNRIESRRVV